jgi:uncharacterized protein YndB with AHSA1/START domain
MRMHASRELLAPTSDVWALLAEPYHLPDWWPSVSGVEPDRRGVAAGARWQVLAGNEPTLFRRPAAAGTLLVTAAEPLRLLSFQLVAEKLDVTVELEPTAADRTLATITVEGPWLISFRRTLARRAANRLYSLCQTAASL